MQPFSFWAKRIGLALIVVVALAYVPYRITASVDYVKYRTLRRQKQELGEANSSLRHENHKLKREIRRLNDDENAIRDVARGQLGLLRPGEIMFQFENEPLRLAEGTKR